MENRKRKVADPGVEKGVALLEMLADAEQDCSVSALARKAGLSRYKTMRLLESLEEKGVLRCAVESGRYAENEAAYQSLVEEARPVLESLARQHNEAVYLTILKGDEVLFLDMVDCQWQVKAEPLVGKRFPFFSNAAGKVMRAIDSWDLLEKIGKRWRRGQVRFPDLDGFRSELELIREQGVAVDCGGMGEGVITVAVAVRDYAGKVVGALTMLGPSFRLIGARLEQEIIPSLCLGGETLSMKFGYVRP